MQEIRKLPYYGRGGWRQSATDRWMEVVDPSTGACIAQAPAICAAELEDVIAQAAEAFGPWSRTPALKRTQVLYRFRTLILEHMDELARLLARENGKTLEEARGDLLKVKEPLELACGAPSLLMGESLMDASRGYDTVLYREPVGVFAGIAPFNFPAMIPMGWMVPLCIAAGNTIVVKASSTTPMTAMRLLELLEEAGLPQGVVSVITADRGTAQLLLTDSRIKGVCFVGTTGAGLKIYAAAAANGKRVQALCEAKNHALVMDDAVLERTAKGIINSAFGCAGERCMALPVVVAQEDIADRLVERLRVLAGRLKVGCAYDESAQMGPVVTKKHMESVLRWIECATIQTATLLHTTSRWLTVPYSPSIKIWRSLPSQTIFLTISLIKVRFSSIVSVWKLSLKLDNAVDSISTWISLSAMMFTSLCRRAFSSFMEASSLSSSVILAFTRSMNAAPKLPCDSVLIRLSISLLHFLILSSMTATGLFCVCPCKSRFSFSSSL